MWFLLKETNEMEGNVVDMHACESKLDFYYDFCFQFISLHLMFHMKSIMLLLNAKMVCNCKIWFLNEEEILFGVP